MIEKAFTQEKQALDELEHSSQRSWPISKRSSRPVPPMSRRGCSVAITRSKRRARISALAEIKEGICSGCRLQLPPQLISEVKRAQDTPHLPLLPSDALLGWTDFCRINDKPPIIDKTSALEIGESV